MRPKRRNILLVFLVVAILAIGGYLCWTTSRASPPQFITLPDGQRYQFAGVTYATNAIPPSTLIRLIRLLPKSLADRARKHYGSRVTHQTEEPWMKSPQLFVWFKWVGKGTPPANAVASGPNARYVITTTTAELVDDSGATANSRSRVDFVTNVGWSRIAFPIFPRRSREVECLFKVQWGTNAATVLGKINFQNPFYGHYPQWKPEPMPTVKQADGLEVRLDEVMAGSMRDGMTMFTNANGAVGQKLWPAKPGEDIMTQIAYSVRAGKGTNEAWVWENTELSDATGNIQNALLAYSGGGKAFPTWLGEPARFEGWHGSTYPAGIFWPGENAWRVKLTFKRSAGFEPREVVSFRNLPLPAIGTTKTFNITNFAGGQPVVLRSISHQTNLAANGMWLSYIVLSELSTVAVELPGLPAGWATHLVEAGTDAGPASPFQWSEPDGKLLNFHLSSIPDAATRMDLTFSLQKPRVVEFTLKPPPMTNGNK